MRSGRKLGLSGITILAASAALTACAPGRFDAREQWTIPAGSTRAISLEPAQYRLAPGDRVKMTVFGQNNVTGEYSIDAAGTITIPLAAGPIRIKGLTAEKAARYIQEQLVAVNAFRDPRVSVELVSFAPVYVLGEVNRPGEFIYRPGMSLFSAVALAGGFTFRANQNRAFIRASDERIETDYKIKSDIAVMPGDVIRVPEVSLFGGR
jgi:polysaccharide export outer membrane protein